MIDVARKICNAGETTIFSFQTTSVAYCVKNFTQSPVLVCLGKWGDSQSIKIGAGMWQCVKSNPNPKEGMTRAATAVVLVQAEADGEVEVQRDD